MYYAKGEIISLAINSEGPEMGTKGTLGFTRSLQAGLPITDAAAGRISGSKGEGGQLDIRGAAIKDTATPIESLPDIDVSADLLEEMSDTRFKKFNTSTITKNYTKNSSSIGLPSNVKKIASLENRMENIVDRASARRDPYAARLLKEQDDL